MNLWPRVLSAFSNLALAARTDRLKNMVDIIRRANFRSTIAIR